MSTNNIPTRLQSVEKLLQRISIAEKTQQKEIRISLDEAKDITRELALLTTNLGSVIGEIHAQITDIKKASNEVDVKFDGGSF